jgi:hypothetical protein
MNKTNLLEQLRAAKSAHIQWRARAQALVSGLPLEGNAVPVLHTDCKFGKWYYGAGQVLSQLPAFHEIDQTHEQLHLVYMQIFKLIFGNDDRSALSRLFGSKKKHETAKLESAKKLLPSLVAISKDLLTLIESLEKEVRNMSEEELLSVV